MYIHIIGSNYVHMYTNFNFKVVHVRMYRIDLNFGGAKLWRIWRIDSISPNLTLQFF